MQAVPSPQKYLEDPSSIDKAKPENDFGEKYVAILK
jgi:hypothetical protein